MLEGTLLAPNAPDVEPLRVFVVSNTPVTSVISTLLLADTFLRTTPVAPLVACVIVSPALSVIFPVVVIIDTGL